MDCPRGLVAYEDCQGVLRSLRFDYMCFFALLQELCTILLVYGVLFDTSGAHNRGDSRVDRVGNVEIKFGAFGLIPSTTEVFVCI